MREFKFRGKRLDNGEWVKGSLCQGKCESYIACINDFYENYLSQLVSDDDFYEVDPATVGQYTGLKKNGIPIYEGDIIKIKISSSYSECYSWEAYKIEYDEKELCFKAISESHKLLFNISFYDNVEIIGNIYEHENLLKREG